MMAQGDRPPQSIFYADVKDPKGHRCEVQISDDTGSPVNWIHPYFFTQYGLTWKHLPKPICYEDASGNQVKATRFIKLEWIGKNNRKYNTEFYVMPEKVKIPRLVLGHTFVENNGRAKEVCRLDPRVQDAKILTQAPITVSSDCGDHFLDPVC
jgi:hypothetical protein